jgi:hypothetical protein
MPMLLLLHNATPRRYRVASAAIAATAQSMLLSLLFIVVSSMRIHHL